MTGRVALVGLLALALSGCGDTAKLPLAAGFGAEPALPAPAPSLIPTVNIAPAQGWPAGVKPQQAPGTSVAAFASGLDHPRWLLLLPNGDVLVAETNAPPKPEDGKGIKGWVMGLVMKRAGAGVPSANRITLLRDTDNDGVADLRSTLLEGLNSPFGMALIGSELFVANSDAVMKFPYTAGDTRIAVPGVQVVALPAGPINHHWTKNLIASADGSKLYVTIGSNSNVAERGMAAEAERAAIWEVDVKTGAHRIFASGLRNPNGMAWEPSSGALWTVVNERDELGSDLVPDYLSSVRDGAFYGWPYSYYGHHVDERVQPPSPELVAKAIAPDYALGPHTASLGLAAAAGNSLPAAFANGMFIGQHGSWNRRPHSGYKVIFVPFAGGKPAGPPVDVLTGFLSADGKAYGRPVGVALDRRGALLVADDVGNVIWRVSAATPLAARPRRGERIHSTIVLWAGAAMKKPLSPGSVGLQEPLDKTEAVAAEIERAANHALVIGTVLAHEVPADLQVGEVAQAIEQTKDLEQKLAESAEKLADVSSALEQEIERGRAVTRELTETREQVEQLVDDAKKV